MLSLLTRPRHYTIRPLTLSGDLVNDAYRRGGQGDGEPTGSHAGTGIWPAYTNLCTNGNATTDTTGITDNSSTTTRVTTGTVKFGSTAFEVVSGNAAANEGPSQLIDGGLASTQYTVSAWAWLVSGAATVRAVVYDTIGGKQGGTPVVLTAIPQRITVTATTGALGLNEASYIETTVQAEGTWRIGGWQVETGTIASPYRETDGGTSTTIVGAARLPVPRGFNVRAGAVIMSMRPEWASTVLLTDAGLFSWGELAGSRWLVLFYEVAGDRYAGRRSDTAGSNASTAIQSFSALDSQIVGLKWAPDTIGVAANGGAWSSAANTTIPSFTTSPLLSLGDMSGMFSPRSLNGNVIWIAFYGPGGQFLSNGDSQHVARLENIIEPLTDLPRSDDLVAFWDGVNDRYWSFA